MHSVPGDGFSGPIARPHGLEHGAVDPDLRVAAHARVCRRDPGKSTGFNCRMTVAAVDPELTGMVLVAELDGLLSRHTHIGGVPGSFEAHNQADPAAYQQEDDSNADESNRVRRARE